MTSCVRDYKGHSLVQTSFTEPPNSVVCYWQGWTHCTRWTKKKEKHTHTHTHTNTQTRTHTKRASKMIWKHFVFLAHHTHTYWHTHCGTLFWEFTRGQFRFTYFIEESKSKQTGCMVSPQVTIIKDFNWCPLCLILTGQQWFPWQQGDIGRVEAEDRAAEIHEEGHAICSGGQGELWLVLLSCMLEFWRNGIWGTGLSGAKWSFGGMECWGGGLSGAQWSLGGMEYWGGRLSGVKWSLGWWAVWCLVEFGRNGVLGRWAVWCQVEFGRNGVLGRWAVWCLVEFGRNGVLGRWAVWCQVEFGRNGVLGRWAVWCQVEFGRNGMLGRWAVWCPVEFGRNGVLGW